MSNTNARYIVINRDGKRSFPLTAAQLQDLARNEVLLPDTVVESAYDHQRQRAADVPVLANIFRQHVLPVPSMPRLHPAPMASFAPDPARSAEFELDEAARQYKTLNWFLVLGVPFSLGIIGIAMIIYAMIQKPALRRRVAALGVEPVAWARPLDAHLFRTIGIIVACIVLPIGGCVAVGIVGGTLMAITQTAPARSEAAQNQIDADARMKYLQTVGDAIVQARKCETTQDLLDTLGTAPFVREDVAKHAVWEYHCADGFGIWVTISADGHSILAVNPIPGQRYGI